MPAILLLTAVLLPLAAFVLLILMGRRFGNPLSGYVATGLMAASFVCTMLAMIDWYSGGPVTGRDWGFERGPINLPVHWIPIGTAAHSSGIAQETPGWLDVGIYIDSLTIAMFAMITLVATLVHIFSLGWMTDDEWYPRFFAYLGLFCFAMLALLIGGTLLNVVISWQLVAFASWLLIGFWNEKPIANSAVIQSFIIHRIGDVGLLIGLGILISHLGNLNLPQLWLLLSRAGTGHAIALPDGTIFSARMLTFAGIGIFCGAIAMGAQFPLHVWLADAIESPIPASALVCGGTLLAGGVYLLARLFPILTPDTKLLIAVIGVISLTLGAVMAVFQTDIKKVLAFTTMSQVGFMFLGIGIGSWVGALFHLITIGFFNTLLFLGAASVLQATRGERELPRLGGLMRKIPFTAVTFLIGILAMSGVGFVHFGFSGFYSRDMILTDTGAFAALGIRLGHSHAYWLLFALPVVATYLTSFSMMRVWMLTFWGKPRSPKLVESAGEFPMMWGVLIVLAVLSIIGGRWMNVREMVEGSLQECTGYCRQFDERFDGFETVWPTAVTEEALDTSPAGPLEAGRVLVDRYLGPAGFTCGILLAFGLYFRGISLAAALGRIPPIPWIRIWLLNQMYLDEVYLRLIAFPMRSTARWVAWLDRTLFFPTPDREP